MFKKIIFSKRISEIILILGLGLFLNTPFQVYAIQAGLILTISLIIAFIYFILYESYNNKYLTKTYFIIIAFFPSIYALISKFSLGQSFMEGISANFSFLGFLVAIYFYYYFKNNNIKNLENSIINLGWISFLTISSIKLAFPEQTYYISSYDGTREYLMSAKNIDSSFIPWVGFIYLAMYNFRSKKKYLLYGLVLLSFPIFFNNARIYLVSILLCFMIFYLKELTRSNKIKIKIGLFILFPLSFLILTFSDISTQFIFDKVDLFYEAYSSIVSGDSNDVSSLSRVNQFESIYNKIQENYFFGLGVLSDSTSKKYISDYFFSTDLGLLGVIFNYGIIGFLILSYQVRIFSKYFKSISHSKNIFLVGTLYYLLFIYISSIFTGSYVFSITRSFLLLSVLIFGLMSFKKNKNASSNYIS